VQIGGILIIRKSMIAGVRGEKTAHLQSTIDWLCTRYGVLLDPNECLTWTETWDNNNVVPLPILDLLTNINWLIRPYSNYTDILIYRSHEFSVYQIGHYCIDINSNIPQALIYKNDIIVDVGDPLVALEFKLAVF
jgi:hypothetical protein